MSQPSLNCPTPATVGQIPFITGMDRVAENPGQSPQNPYLLQSQGPRSLSHLVEAREIARKQGKVTVLILVRNYIEIKEKIIFVMNIGKYFFFLYMPQIGLAVIIILLMIIPNLLVLSVTAMVSA